MAFSQSDGLPRHIYRGFPENHPAVIRDRELQAVTGACMLVRHDAFDLVRGFDETFANGFEDIDLCLRLRTRGFRIWYCGTTDVLHLESVSIRPTSISDEAASDPNLELFRARWGATVFRDELSVYATDGLISVDSDDVYPLRISCKPELAQVSLTGGMAELADLLATRSRQVFDLEQVVGYLNSLLRDHGVNP